MKPSKRVKFDPDDGSTPSSPTPMEPSQLLDAPRWPVPPLFSVHSSRVDSVPHPPMAAIESIRELHKKIDAFWRPENSSLSFRPQISSGSEPSELSFEESVHPFSPLNASKLDSVAPLPMDAIESIWEFQKKLDSFWRPGNSSFLLRPQESSGSEPSKLSFVDSVHPFSPLNASKLDCVPPPPLDAIESVREMYEKINPVEKIDVLVSFVENQLHEMNTPSEAGSSSLESWLDTVRDCTKLGEKTIDAISTEAEKFPKSPLGEAKGSLTLRVLEGVRELDAVEAMRSLTLNFIKGVEELHCVFIGLSVAAFAAESYTRGSSTENECKELLLKILELTKDVKQYREQMPHLRGMLRNAVSTIVEGSVICCDYKRAKGFRLFSKEIRVNLRFWSAITSAAQLEKTLQQLRDVKGDMGPKFLKQSAMLPDQHSFNMGLRILNQSTMPQEHYSLPSLEFKPVGIEEQLREVKALLDMDGVHSALAVIVCGFGGVGKSTLAASVVHSLNWSSMNFKFCRVAIDDKTPDRTSHIIKLQKDIIYNLGGVKLDLQDPQEGRFHIKEVLKKNSSLLFIDNLVDKDYIQNLLPPNLSPGEQKTGSDVEKKMTKLRILITSRDKNVKAELNINCHVHEVLTLSKPASQRLLLETITEGKMVEDKDFGEKSMINEVADACRGVPLLLSVFGKHLRVERNEESYEEALDVLREVNLDSYRGEHLGTKLMFMYHKIEDVEVKDAFLDICVYFHGWKWNLVADIVDIRTLKDLHMRMLVSKSASDEVIVHDILRLMGMKEARLTRFSNYKELSDVMEDNLDGFRNVKGISLVNDNQLIEIQSTQLEAMRQSLRVLMLGDWVKLDGPPCNLAFRNLRYLHVGDITAFPFKDPSKLDKLRGFLNRSKLGMNLCHLPSSLKRICHEVPDVECDKFAKLPFQNLSSLKSFIVKTRKSVELPNELHLPASLVDLDLRRCKNLPKDIGHLTALQSLVLDGSDLKCLPKGFGKLKKLKHLSMDYCSKLACLPEGIGMLSSLEVLSIKDCRSLGHLPESLGRLLCLQKLELSGSINLQLLPETFGELRMHKLTLCGLLKLQKLPSSFGNMPLLKDLIIESCRSLKFLPDSFLQLKMLETLKIIHCTKLSILPEDFGRLRCLKHMTLEECHLLKELPRGFGALPALKTFTLRRCNSFMNLPRDFFELTSLEELHFVSLPLERILDGFGKLKRLRFLYLFDCFQLKTLSNDFENMAALEQLTIQNCPEMEGAMMERIPKLQHCYMADIDGSRNLLEKWKHMQSEIEHPVAVLGGAHREDQEENRGRAIGVALLHGKCVEVNDTNGQLMERSSLLVGLEDGITATVALIMLPIQMRAYQHQTLQRFVEMARETAKSNGSSKLQIVCATKVDLKAERRAPTEEEERAEEGGIRQILLSLPKGSCAIPSSECKRVKILTYCCATYSDDKLSFFMADEGIDMEGRKSFKNLKFTAEDEITKPDQQCEFPSNPRL